MLDMGFIDDVERIAAATPATRQTLLFSATLEGAIGNLAMRLLKSPKRISVAAAQARHENIEQRLMYVDDMAHKNRLLDHLLRDVDLNQALVFTATKRDADSLADELSAAGHAAAALHGDMNQRERNRTLLNLRRGNVRVLVATDVAARGIDVAGITHVINFDLPKFAEDYVHRIGRTGRAGASGIAVSFASNRDAMNLKKIERFTGQPIKTHTVEGMEPKFKPRPASSQPRSGAGRGNGGGFSNRNNNGGGFGRSNGGGNGSNFSRHAAPDSRHEHSQDQRREGHKHSRFSNDAQPRSGFSNGNVNGNVGGNRAPAHHAPAHHAPSHHAPAHRTTAPAGAPRRPQGTSFSLGRGHNSTNGNKR
jgi:superfamily II DNA/RNA helicase